QACGEGTQAGVVCAGWVSLCRRGADERSDSALRFDDAGTLELGVDPRDRVGIDLEVNRQLAHGRQLVPGTQAARGDGRAQPALELRVDWGRVALVDGDE